MKLKLNTSKPQIAETSQKVNSLKMQDSPTKLLQSTEQDSALKSNSVPTLPTNPMQSTLTPTQMESPQSNLPNQDLNSTSQTLADKLAQPVQVGKPIEKPSLQDLMGNAPIGHVESLGGLPEKTPLASSNNRMAMSNPIPTTTPSNELAKTPATVPITDIPPITDEKYKLLADANDTLSEKTIEEFEERMQGIVDAFGNTGLHDAMKRVLEYTQEHNELKAFLRKEDIQLFVRGARASYAAVAKQKTANRSKKSKSTAIDADIMDSLMDLDIQL